MAAWWAAIRYRLGHEVSWAESNINIDISHLSHRFIISLVYGNIILSLHSRQLLCSVPLPCNVKKVANALFKMPSVLKALYQHCRYILHHENVLQLDGYIMPFGMTFVLWSSRVAHASLIMQINQTLMPFLLQTDIFMILTINVHSFIFHTKWQMAPL